MAALRSYETLDGANPRAWVMTIARNKAIDHHRARGEAPLPKGDDLPDVAAPRRPSTTPSCGRRWPSSPTASARPLAFASPPTSATARSRARWTPREEAARRSVHEGLKKLRETVNEGGAMSELDAIEAQLRGRGDADDQLAGARHGALPRRRPASGDAEVAFATLDTPVGRRRVAATPRGIVSVGLPNHPLDDFVERLAERDLTAGRRGARQARPRPARAHGVLRAADRRDVRPRPRLDAGPGRLLPQGS